MPDRILRIAILGDSSSAGIGDGKDIYPYQLFERLQRCGGVCVDNWASPGLSSADACKAYLKRVTKRSFDLLVIYLGNNEGSRSRYKGTYRPFPNRLREEFRRFRSVRRPFVSGDRRQYVFSKTQGSSEIATKPADFYRNLRTIIRRARRVGTEVVLVNPVANLRFPAGLGSENFPFYRYVGLRDTIGPELVAVDADSEILVQGIRWHGQGRLAEASACYMQVDPCVRYCYQVARNNLAVAQHEGGDQTSSVRTLSEALDADPFDRAILLYNLARIRGSNHILQKAYEADGTLYRIKGAYRQVIARLAKELPVHLIDMADIVQDDHFVDYCHLTREGHGLLAEAIHTAVLGRFKTLRQPGSSNYRCEFPSPDYFFRSCEDLASYYSIKADWGEAEILLAFEEVCGAELGQGHKIVEGKTSTTSGASLREAILKTVQRALCHPAIGDIADLVSFPVRYAHEIGSFPEFYLYRLLRAYDRGLDRSDHREAWREWVGNFPVRSGDDYDRLIQAWGSGPLDEDEADWSLSHRDRVLNRVEEILRRPDLYENQSSNRRKTIMYWYTRESFRFGTQSRPSMLYDRVRLEELAESVAVAWIIERVKGPSGAQKRIDRCRRRIEALIGVHERFATRLASDDSKLIHETYAASLQQLSRRGLES